MRMTINLAAIASDEEPAGAATTWLSDHPRKAIPDSIPESRMNSGLIVVIDDDVSVRRSTKLLLKSFGFDVATFDSADAFLGFDKTGQISCLIADVQMPGVNGLQLQSILAESGSSIPIVFITAFEDAASRQQAMKAGAAAFLSKPFSDDQLLRVIELALQRRVHRGGDSQTAFQRKATGRSS
jgi:FixJ family two-component response regulator